MDNLKWNVLGIFLVFFQAACSLEMDFQKLTSFDKFTATLSSPQSHFNNKSEILVDIKFSQKVSSLELSAFVLLNADALSLNETTNGYRLKIEPQNDGYIEVKLDPSAVRNTKDETLETSNVLSFEVVRQPLKFTFTTNRVDIRQPLAEIQIECSVECPNLRVEDFDSQNVEFIGVYGAGKIYTATVKPLMSGPAGIALLENAVKDKYGNYNDELTYLIFDYLNELPEVAMKEVDISGGGNFPYVNSDSYFYWEMQIRNVQNIQLSVSDFIITGDTTGCSISVYDYEDALAESPYTATYSIDFEDCTGAGPLTVALKKDVLTNSFGGNPLITAKDSVILDNVFPELAVTSPLDNFEFVKTEPILLKGTCDRTEDVAISMNYSFIASVPCANKTWSYSLDASYVFGNYITLLFEASTSSGNVITVDRYGTKRVEIYPFKYVHIVDRTFVGIRSDGTLVSVGSDAIADQDKVKSLLHSKSSSYPGYTGVKSNGRVVNFGSSRSVSSVTAVTNIFRMESIDEAFAGLTADGNVHAWGYVHSGGTTPSALSGTKSVVDIRGWKDFFIAELESGQLFSWGAGYPVTPLDQIPAPLKTGRPALKTFIPNRVSAALMLDGSLYSWSSLSFPYSPPAGTYVDLVQEGREVIFPMNERREIVPWGIPDNGTEPELRPHFVKVKKAINKYNMLTVLRSNGSVVSAGGKNQDVFELPELQSEVMDIKDTGACIEVLKRGGDTYCYKPGFAQSLTLWGTDFISSAKGVISGTEYGLRSDGTIVGVEKGALPQFTDIVQLSPGYSSYFASIARDVYGKVHCWTDDTTACNGVNALPAVNSVNVQKVYSNKKAFVSHLSDGSLKAWGVGASSNLPAEAPNNISYVVPSDEAFAAITSRGGVFAWGETSHGGVLGAKQAAVSEKVKKVISNGKSFVALKTDGSIVCWGDSTAGGDCSSAAANLFGITDVQYTESAYAALRDDGQVIVWGNSSTGGAKGSAFDGATTLTVRIVANKRAFLAIQDDGSMITWGDPTAGGDSSSVSANLASGVYHVFASDRAFAVHRFDKVYAWGDSNFGGNITAIATSLAADVKEVYAHSKGFLAKKVDGSVVAWGESALATSINSDPNISMKRLELYSNEQALVMRTHQGTLLGYGSSASGSVPPSEGSGTIVNVVSSGRAFAALTSTGKVITWGSSAHGGDSSAVSLDIAADVIEIVATANGFTALTVAGKTISW